MRLDEKYGIKEYVDIDDDGTAVLDGNFTADELRTIANEIDRLKV